MVNLRTNRKKTYYLEQIHWREIIL